MLGVLLLLASQAAAPATDDSLTTALTAEWQDASSGHRLELWADGVWGPRDRCCAFWRVEAGVIEVHTCFDGFANHFHFEGQILVIDDGELRGRYRKLRSLFSLSFLETLREPASRRREYLASPHARLRPSPFVFAYRRATAVFFARAAVGAALLFVVAFFAARLRGRARTVPRPD
jgi:hypothetical protein